jgi:hypothetical protein
MPFDFAAVLLVLGRLFLGGLFVAGGVRHRAHGGNVPRADVAPRAPRPNRERRDVDAQGIV